MFNTDIIHFFQKLEGNFFYWFFEIISFLGQTPMLVFSLIIIITSLDFVKGVKLSNVFCYVFILTFFLKDMIDYPRPLGVDPTLKSFNFEVGQDLTHLQPRKFFELFDKRLLQEVRNSKVPGKGFPSGHTSMVVALMFSCCLIFKKKWMYM